MEAEERPVKIRKLSHGTGNGNYIKMKEEFNQRDDLVSKEKDDSSVGDPGINGRKDHVDIKEEPNHGDSLSSKESNRSSVGDSGVNGKGDHVAMREEFDQGDGLVSKEVDPDASDHEDKDPVTKKEDEVELDSKPELQGQDASAGPPLSKNQLKKIRRKQEWEAGRDFRKAKRKEKIQEKRIRKRAAREEERAAEPSAARQGDAVSDANGVEEAPKRQPFRSVQLPITFVFDCGFDDLMLERERISLAAQLTRCYSDNSRAQLKAHLAFSSFGGHLKDRFDNVLSGHHQSWRGVRFLEEDFVEAAEQAKEWMAGERGGKLAGAFAVKNESSADEKPAETGEIIYLSSDSPDTLTELKPYSTYIIGGLVDRNRHKGICYKRAKDRGMKTARLPIGEYMEMTSRFVLATNHVSEIMLKWLELGNWGEAFLKVMPKRKGGVLKGASPAQLDDMPDVGSRDDAVESKTEEALESSL
ncbi:tRNA methyltransferase 10 [Trapelia coarctata]|nr:tRNA methyltransferase 10 [Trapelia coarctata]